MIKSDLENGARALLESKERRVDLLLKALALLAKIEVSVEGVDKEAEEGRRRVAEVRRALIDRIEYLARLRLGEGGKVCLANCQFGEAALTYRHEAYARVVAPLLHYIAEDAHEEILKFLAYAILGDGHVDSSQVYLAVGSFRVENPSKELPLDMYDKIALYVILAAKYGVGVRRVHIGKNVAMIYFDKEYAARAFFEAWDRLPALLRRAEARELYADHILEKLEEMRRYVEGYAEKIKVEHVVRGDKATVFFKDERGDEIARINIRWTGESLHAKFEGAKEKAERLAAILNALGADAQVKKYGDSWRVDLFTDSITAIRRKEWLEAVKSLVEALYERGVINDKRREELLKKVEAGPNVIEIAGVELSVKTKTGKSQRLEVKYQPKSAEAFDYAVRVLKEAGFEEGLHFTAKRPEGNERGYIYLRIPTGLWKLVELKRQGVKWAERAINRLKEIARARGFYELLNEYLKPAEEAETLDPKKVAVEDPESGVRAVVRDLRREWEDGRPRIIVEYETSNRTETFSFIWGVGQIGDVRANVRLNDERAAVLAALTGDESLRRKRGVAALFAKHMLALVRYKGIGWDLLWWYAKLLRE